MKKISNNREGGTRPTGAGRMTQSGGFIKMILLIIAGLVLLKYLYEVDIVGYLTEGRFREILDKVYAFSTEAWVKYREVVVKIWNYIIGWFKKSI